MQQVYPYEYFCSANVVVEIENQPLFETAGLTLSIKETKAPLYGYSSRHFNAVGRGQVLVTGSIVTNYIHQDYITASIDTGLELGDFADPDPQSIREISQSDEDINGFLRDPSALEAINSEIIVNPEENADLIAALQRNFWPDTQQVPGIIRNDDQARVNPHDLSKPLTIKVTFGERTAFNNWGGVTGFTISGVYFVSRSMPLGISEDVIVEEHSFIARNIHPLYPRKQPISLDLDSSRTEPKITVS